MPLKRTGATGADCLFQMRYGRDEPNSRTIPAKSPSPIGKNRAPAAVTAYVHPLSTGTAYKVTRSPISRMTSDSGESKLRA